MMDFDKKAILKYFNNDLNVYRERVKELEDSIMKDSIRMNEIKKKTMELSKIEDSSSNIFSPSEHSVNFILIEIKKLNSEVEKIEQILDKNKIEKNVIEKKIKEIEKILKIVKEGEEEKQEKMNYDEYIEKIKFCSQICLSDSRRCKIELDKIIDKMQNVSRETSE